MIDLYTSHIASQMGIARWQVENCIALLEEGATVPFISRYRKERTGSLDEIQVAEVRHHFLRFTELARRKEAIISSIEEQGRMDDELRRRIEVEIDPRTLEDLYLPYRPKRRTRASVARERGLEPLATAIYAGKVQDLQREAARYLTKDVPDTESALAGARDIIAEQVADMQMVRAALKDLYARWGNVTARVARGKEDDEGAAKYRTYFSFSQRVSQIPSHRLLAILRAAGEGFLTVKVEVREEHAIERIARRVFEPRRPMSAQVRSQIDLALADSYRRLLHPSIENETLAVAKEAADIAAIRAFGENLRQLLLAAPVGQKRTLAIDPGFRTGCKVVCLDAQGNLLHNDTIYPHPPVNEKSAAMRKLSNMIEAYRIEVIAIGNGTAGRETESFIQKMALPAGIRVFSVNEDGASVYSASETAREEFPDYDVTVRGAVSIGRRLMDPLAELVKIDPKSIGVGQYQHDVDQGLLRETLDETVEGCVNRVGVNLNTASWHLLSYVSGIGPALARNIVDYRTANGPFAARSELLKVKRLGDKAYEQCAGFLRIPGATDPLDNSAVHPERYALVARMAADMGVDVATLISDATRRNAIDPQRYVSDEVGLPTLKDILEELDRPGRDPRQTAREFEFSQEIHDIEDVKPGMILPCIVTNITDFGAFVDIGIHRSALIHVSQVADHRVNSPADVLRINQQLYARVISVDVERGRIGMSLRGI